MAHDAFAGIALGGLRLHDLVGPVGQGAHARRGGPGVKRRVVLGGDRRDGLAGGELLGLLERAIAVSGVPNGVRGPVVHRELRPLEGGVALRVVPEHAVLVVVALGIPLADDEPSALRELAELALGGDLDDCAAFGHVGGRAQAMGLAVEQVAARGIELANGDVAEGDALENDGGPRCLPLHLLRRAAPVVAGLVERPVEGGVALGSALAGLGVELFQHEAHRDGRLFRGERVVVAGAHLVDGLVEGVARGGLHLLRVEGLAGRAEALGLAVPAFVRDDARHPVDVGLGVRAGSVDSVDRARERVVRVVRRP